MIGGGDAPRIFFIGGGGGGGVGGVRPYERALKQRARWILDRRFFWLYRGQPLHL